MIRVLRTYSSSFNMPMTAERQLLHGKILTPVQQTYCFGKYLSTGLEWQFDRYTWCIPSLVTIQLTDMANQRQYLFFIDSRGHIITQKDARESCQNFLLLFRMTRGSGSRRRVSTYTLLICPLSFSPRSFVALIVMNSLFNGCELCELFSSVSSFGNGSCSSIVILPPAKYTNQYYYIYRYSMDDVMRRKSSGDH